MTENPSTRAADTTPATTPAIPTGGSPAIPAKRLAACGWCDSTHIADVTCTCKEPCAQGWCPAAVEFESPWVPAARDAVA